MKRTLRILLVVAALLGALGIMQGAMTGACGPGGYPADNKPCGQ